MKYGQSVLLWEKVPEVDGIFPKEIPVLDCYQAQGDRKKRGSVVVYPGGGYTTRAPHEGITIANWLNYIGINAYVAHYRVAPHKHPAPLMDAQRAVRMVRKINEDEGQDNQLVGIIGFSAGGHLACCVSTMHNQQHYDLVDSVDQYSCRPDAAILCYPVASFGKYTHQGSKNNLLGDRLELTERMSPENSVDETTPPCFLWHTAADTAVPVQNSLLFGMALADHKVPFEMHVYPDGHHGLGTISQQYQEVCMDWTNACQKWLCRLGF